MSSVFKSTIDLSHMIYFASKAVLSCNENNWPKKSNRKFYFNANRFDLIHFL